MTEVSTTTYAEVTVHVIGDVDPGESKTRDSPGFADTVDSLWIDGLLINDKDVFEGVDMKDPAVKRIVENIAFAIYDDAEFNILAAYSEGLE